MLGGSEWDWVEPRLWKRMQYFAWTTPATGKLDFAKMAKSRSCCFGDSVLPCCGYTCRQRRIASGQTLLKKLTQQHPAQCPEKIGHCKCVKHSKPCMSKDSATQHRHQLQALRAAMRRGSIEKIRLIYWICVKIRHLEKADRKLCITEVAVIDSHFADNVCMKQQPKKSNKMSRAYPWVY